MSARKGTSDGKNLGSATAKAQHHVLFATAYMANGGNATQAAKSAGYSAKTAGAAGSRLLKNVEVSAHLAQQREEAIEKYELSRDRVLQSLTQALFWTSRTCSAQMVR